MKTARFLQSIDWINTTFLLITPALVLTFVPLTIWYEGLDWRLIALFIAFSFMTGISITAGYHRLFSHRSYEADSWLKIFYLIFGAVALQGSALKWSTDHRRHHRFVDTEQDPYNIKRGFWFAHIGWVFFKEQEGFERGFAPDLANDRLISWQNKYYIPIALIVGFGIPLLIGASFGQPWGGLLFGGFARVVLVHHCTFFINSLCHLWGKQTYSIRNTARDNFVMALLTYGEGYHNFHHKFQADYRNGIKWYHWDPTKWWIRLFSLFGSTRRLKTVPESEILRARLETESAKLIGSGVPIDRFENIKIRLEAAQSRLRELKEAYQLRKRELSAKHDHHLAQIRIELALAKIEFRAALAQWRLMLKSAQQLATTLG